MRHSLFLSITLSVLTLRLPTMSKHHYCAVPGCTAVNVSLHTLPLSPALRQKWLNLIFSGSVPENVSPHLRLCTAHFTPDCIENQMKYNSGFAKRLNLIPGSVPTLLNPTPNTKRFTCEVGCQTDPSKRDRRTVGTQFGTYSLLQKNVKTTAQKHPGSPPSKRARLDDHSIEVPEDHSTYNLEKSVMTKSTVLSQPPSSVQDTPKYLVFEDGLMPLFETCPVCSMTCQVKKIVQGTSLSIEQSCPFCPYYKKWTSQPLIGNTPAGNLQQSAATFWVKFPSKKEGTEHNVRAVNLQCYVPLISEANHFPRMENGSGGAVAVPECTVRQTREG